MNGNSSKQVLLSVLGIAILVVAVVGVSFAFFSYTKSGATNNTIQTGEIYTYLTDGDEIKLTNVFPQVGTRSTVLDPIADSHGSTSVDGVGAITFSVTGKNTSSTDITYNVYLMYGDTVKVTVDGNEKTLTKLDDADVSVIMKSTASDSATITNNIAEETTMAKVMAAVDTTTPANGGYGQLIASSKIAANSTSDVTHTYTLNMYVNSGVKISDTDLTVNGTPTRYCAHKKEGTIAGIPTEGSYGCELYKDGTTLKSATKEIKDGNITATEAEAITTWLPVYSDHYYSVRVKVVANTTAANATLNYGG